MMEDTSQKKTRAKKTSTSSTKKTQNKTLTEVGEEKQVVEISLYSTVQLLDYWGKWNERQYLIVDKFLGDWVICEHWYSTNTHNEKFSQLGVPLVVKKERLRIHPEKPMRVMPWDWYTTVETFVKFMKSKVGGIGEPRSLEKSENAAYK